MLPPEWMVISMSARLAAVPGVGGGHPVGEVAPGPPRVDPVHVVGVGVPRVPSGHRLEGAHIHHRDRDHRPREGARVELPRELGDGERPLLLVTVDPAVKKQPPAPACSRWR